MKTVEEMAAEIVAAVRSRHNETVDPGVTLIVMDRSREDARALVASALRSARRSALEEAADALKAECNWYEVHGGEAEVNALRRVWDALRSLADAGEEK